MNPLFDNLNSPTLPQPRTAARLSLPVQQKSNRQSRNSSVRWFGLISLLWACAGLQTAHAGNLLTNPGFEEGPTGWSSPANSLRGGASIVITNAALAHSGNNCLSNFNAAGWSSAEQGDSRGGWATGVAIPVSDAKYYRLSGWVKVPSAVSTPADLALRYRFEPSGSRTDVGLLTIGSEDWTMLESDWIQPQMGDTYVSYWEIHTLANGTAFYADDCAMEESDGCAIAGVVKDNSGNPLEGAQVQVKLSGTVLKTTTSAASGAYTFHVQPVAGLTYTLNASKLNYSSPSSEVSVNTVAIPGVATAADLVLTALPMAKVSGAVTSASTGSPVPGATVTITSASGSLAAATDTDGKYSVMLAANTAYTLKATKLPLASALETINLTADMTVNFAVSNVMVIGVYAESLPDGPISSIANSGTLGGRFLPLSATKPVVSTYGIFRAAYFNNAPMVLTNDAGWVTAPASITGASANYTVSAWLLEPDEALPSEQTYISWAKRGGPDGSNCELGYGANGSYGAAGHWGAPDMAWGTPPTGGVWHNVILTWDSTAGVETAYIDGVLAKSMSKTLDIASDLPVVLGSGYWYDGTTLSPDIVFSGYIAKVEIMSVAASASEVAQLAANSPVAHPTGTISGKVVTTDATSPAGFAVTATDASGAVQASTASAADGSYSLVLPPQSVKVKAIKAGYITMPAPQAAVITLGQTNTLADFAATPSMIHGVIVDANTGAPIYNGVVQAGGRGSQAALVTDKTGAYNLTATGCGGAEVFADAVGYHCANLLITAVGDISKRIALIPQAEAGVITNGGFETVVSDQPVAWEEAARSWPVGGLTFSASTNAFSGMHSLWYSGSVSYDAVAQYQPVVEGYVYSCYFKAVADPDVLQWFPMFSFRGADDGEIKGWISGEPGRDGYVHTPPTSWTQYLLFHTYSGDATQPFVRIAPPANAVSIAATFCYETSPPDGKGCYVDDVVIDRSLANEPLVSTGSDSGPVLTIRKVGNGVELSWPQGTLLESLSLGGPWQTNNASSPYPITNPEGTRFYKLITQ